jgi:hypothetical protein
MFSLIALHLTGAFSLYVYWRLESWGSAKYDCFGAALLLISIAFKCWSLLDTLFYGTRFESWPDTIWVDGSLLSIYFKGEAITHFGILLTVAAWRLSVGNKLERFSFLRGTLVANNRMPCLFYGLAVITKLFLRITGIDYGAFTHLFVTIDMIGVAAIYFIVTSGPLVRSAVSVMKAVGLALPISYLSLDFGMKEFILAPFVPAAIIAWLSFSGFTARVSLVAVSICVLAISQVYIGFVRATVWQGDQSYSTTGLVTNVLNSMDWEIFGYGLDEVSSRVNPTQSHAITVALVERDGVRPVETFAPIPANFIPRIVWADKQVLKPSAEHTKRIMDSDLPLSEITSASSAGFFTELYMGGGIIGMILGSLVYGFLAGKLQVTALPILPGFGIAAFNFQMFYWTLRLDEFSVVHAYSGMVLYFILSVFLFQSYKIFKSYLE